jgi:hypothetical protein
MSVKRSAVKPNECEEVAKKSYLLCWERRRR